MIISTIAVIIIVAAYASKLFRTVLLGYLGRITVALMHILSIKDDPRCRSTQSIDVSRLPEDRRSTAARILTPAPIQTPTPLSVPSVSGEHSRKSSANRASLTLDQSYMSTAQVVTPRSTPITASISVSRRLSSYQGLTELLDGPDGHFTAFLLTVTEFSPALQTQAQAAATLAAQRLGFSLHEYCSDVTLLKGPGTSEFGFVSETTGVSIADDLLPQRIPGRLSLSINQTTRTIELYVRTDSSSFDGFAHGPEGEVATLISKVPLSTLTQIVSGRRKALANLFPDLRSTSASHFMTLVATPSLDLMFGNSEVRDFWSTGLSNILRSQTEGFQLWPIVNTVMSSLE